MKKLAFVLIGLGVCALPITAWAGVLGSDHDLVGEVVGGNTQDKVCFACHVPHQAQGTKLWAQTPSGTFTGVQDLCYTCHNGTVTSVGTTTAFNTAKQQHKAVGGDCSSTSGCHDVHNQNPNGTGKFTTAGVTLTAGSYCQTCHDATPFNGNTLGDHTAGTTHFTNGTTFTCNQCHSVHGAEPQTTNPSGLTNPILLADNQPGAFYGAFCISCHSGTAPAAAVPGTGGVAASDVWNYAEANAGGNNAKHPTTTTATTYPVGGCNKCHDVHDHTTAPTPPKYLLMADNANSGYCVSCHTGGSAPPIGSTHPTNVVTDAAILALNPTPALPWANEIDEDGTPGADWPSATGNRMVCETCHSVHKQGFTGTNREYFLRHANGSENELCKACHTAK